MHAAVVEITYVGSFRQVEGELREELREEPLEPLVLPVLPVRLALRMVLTEELLFILCVRKNKIK